MVWYKRLRLRLFASQFAVVIAGVVTMLIVSRSFIPTRLSAIITQQLGRFDLPSELSALVQSNLVDSINQLILVSLGIAAAIAFLVGIFSSLLLWFIIITPIRNMANSSQRIANGRYDERVTVPKQAGEAMALMATNFNQMAQSLESIEEHRMRLMGNVTHELRTPLSSLSGYVEGLTDGVFEPNDKLFFSMKKQIGRMKRLIDDTQFLSKAESGWVELAVTEVNLADVMNQVIFYLTPNQMAKKQSIIFDAPAEDIYVLADYDRLTQILTNLLSNAIQYTPQNGQIQLEINNKIRSAEVMVIDSGIGIPAEALPFVFERFYRVDESRSREHGGSGVGLTISRHLARGMSGELTAESEGVGKGSRFILQLRKTA
ncbi:MAG: histidine kinase [Cellvibrionaceae bacterium]|jgi:histidine kinase